MELGAGLQPRPDCFLPCPCCKMGPWVPWTRVPSCSLEASLSGGIWGTKHWALMGNLSPWPWFLSLQPNPNWKSQFL